MTKRGQITLFIIFGIVLLIIIGITYYLYTSSSTSSSDLAKSAMNQAVPAELLPFKAYVEQCGEDLLWEAVQRAGMQGGLIYPEELGLKFNYYEQTEADGLKLFEKSNLEIPYWTYMSGDNDCNGGCVKMAYPPPLDGDAPASIQTQIETYVERNFDKCLKNLEQLEPFGVEYTSLSDIKADVEFSESDVRLIIDNLFSVKSIDDDLEIRYFMSTVPIPFREYYNDALYLAIMVDKTNFLEKATLGWISAYSGMDSKKFPPKSGSESSFVSTTYWATQEVRDKLTDVMASNVPMFTLTTSKNYHPVDTFYNSSYYLVKKKFYDAYILPSPNRFSKYNVDFSYNYWSSYIDLNGGDEFIKPQSSSVDFFPWIGVNKVQTMYSISYPVLISLDNPEDIQPDGKGFVFNFAVEVNVRNNAIMDENYSPYDYSIFNAYKPEKTMFCDVGQKTSKPVSFTVINGLTNLPESDVQLTQVCGKETCQIGLTNSAGIFNGSLSPCEGGLIQLLKPNFETVFLKVSPSIKESFDLGEIIYEPYRTINLTAHRLRFSRVSFDESEGSTWDLISSQPLLMSDDETAIIMLERIKEENDFIIRDSFSTVGLLENGDDSTIRFLPGTYEGQIVFVKHKKVVIPPNERCFEGSLFMSGDCITIPEEEIVLEEYPGGGAYFNNETMPLVISKEKLDHNKWIDFKIIYADLPGFPEFARYVEDLEVLGQIEEFSAMYRSLIEPEYKLSNKID